MEHSCGIVVQKFGGSSVADPQKIKNVAQFIKNRLLSTERICVVVSAMGHSTNELLGLAHQVNADAPKRELDMLISCGERSSMALLAMALSAIGIRALSLTGSQSGIITDDQHSGAEIIAIRPMRVLEAFKTHQVVIIAGFQGMSRAREITTLKRGGSDTTAVAMAAALKAERCEIYTDVAGVMDIDPKIKEYARPLDLIKSDQMCALALYGAKVLAYDAARIAELCGIELVIAQSGSAAGQGTLISERDEYVIKPARAKKLRALTHMRSLICTDKILDNSYVLCASLVNNQLRAYVSQDLAQEQNVKTDISLISLHLYDHEAVGQIIEHAMHVLAEAQIVIIDMIVAFRQVHVIVREHELERALDVLYEDAV